MVDSSPVGEYLRLASYCGSDNANCSDRRPCADCLALCNVFFGGRFLRELGKAPSTHDELEALKPFAQAADDLDESDRDEAHLWEHPAAMNITVGNLRRAAALVKRGEERT
jgi:hypothetical protein